MARGNERQLVVFKLDQEEFCGSIMLVQQIINVPKITHLPDTPTYVHGIINLRGKVIPVINLKAKLGMYNTEVTDKDKIIIVQTDDNQIGMFVDEVREILMINESDIDPAPAIASSINRRYIEGVGKIKDRMLIILDLGKILTEEEEAALMSKF